MQRRGRSGPGRSSTESESNPVDSMLNAGQSNSSHSLRRSARRAGILTGTQQGSSSAQHTEQPQASRREAIESNPQQLDGGYQHTSEVIEGSGVAIRDTLTSDINEDTNEAIRSLTPAEDSINNQTNHFIMNVIIEPPSEIRPGDLLQPPIVIKLENRNGRNADDEIDIEDGNLWAQASVVSEDGMVALAPPQPNLITGTLVDSVRPATPEKESQESGYLTFPDLAIHQTGRFRIRISLIKMPTTDESEAINLQSIVTRIIIVDREASTPSIGKAPLPA